MKKILIPTDFSKEAKNTLIHGIKLAQILEREILLVYSADIYGYVYQYGNGIAVPPAPYPHEIKDIEDEVQKVYNEWINDLRQEFQTLPSTELTVERGSQPYILEDMDKNKDVDMVLITGKNEDDFFTRFADDNNYRTVRHVHCPVMVIPPDANFQPFTRIAYVTDYEKEEIDTLQKLTALANPFRAIITALHICEDINFEERIKKEGFEEMVRKKVGYPFIDHAIRKADEPVEKILEFTQRFGANLIAMKKENRSFFEKLFSQSKTKQMIWQTNIPLVIYKN